MSKKGSGIRDQGSGSRWLALVVVALVLGVVVFCWQRNKAEDLQVVSSPDRLELLSRQVDKTTSRAVTVPEVVDVVPNATQPEESPEEALSEEEKLAAAMELLVEEFDSLVDSWRGAVDTKAKAKTVTMADIDKFSASFRKIPKDRRNECIHRALNLIPDENVMLLAGILMDKTMDKDTVETVYNDILNRDEDVKKPILQQIFKDKSHPCWADTAWIFDVTGELPKSK